MPPVTLGASFRSAVVNVLASAGSALAGLMATAVMTRYMDLETFGAAVLLVSGVNALAIFEGLRPVVIYRLADPSSHWPTLFHSTARINTSIAASILALGTLLHSVGITSFLSSATASLFALTIPTFFALMQYWIFLDALGDTAFTGLARSIAWTILYAAFAALALLGSRLEVFALTLLLMNLALFVVLRVRFEAIRPATAVDGLHIAGTPTETHRLFRAAANTIIFNIAAVTINLADRVIIGSIRGSNVLGNYAGPAEIVLRANGLIRAGLQVFLPWAAQQRDDITTKHRYWVASITLLTTIGGIGCSLCLCWRDNLAIAILGARFADAGDLLGIFVAALLVSSFGYVCILFLNSIGNFHTQRTLYLFGAGSLLSVGVPVAYFGRVETLALVFLSARCVDLIMAHLILTSHQTVGRRRLYSLFSLTLVQFCFGWLKAPLAITATIPIGGILAVSIARSLRKQYR